MSVDDEIGIHVSRLHTYHKEKEIINKKDSKKVVGALVMLKQTCLNAV